MEEMCIFKKCFLFIFYSKRDILCYENFLKGARGSIVVKALCYKPEGRGFDTR
jgi:hypothetical protein